MSDFIWVEKYRPKTIEDCILPESIKKTFRDFLKTGEIPNMLLAGPPGVGKTTVAKALCNELGVDFYVINGSDEGRFSIPSVIMPRTLHPRYHYHRKRSIRLLSLMRQITQETMFNCSYGRSLRNSQTTVGLYLPVTIKIKSSSHYIRGVRLLNLESKVKRNRNWQGSFLKDFKKF
mgnify:CR=1 FL=1